MDRVDGVVVGAGVVGLAVARELAVRIEHQEQSIARFLEISTEDQPPH